jgi:hypothetical protein
MLQADLDGVGEKLKRKLEKWEKPEPRRGKREKNDRKGVTSDILFRSTLEAFSKHV